jgi:hypothetical protein
MIANYDTVTQGQFCLPTKAVAKEYVKNILDTLNKTAGGATKYVVELGLCWEIVLIMAFGTFLISILYIVLLRWLTKPLLYLSMMAILIGFVVLGGWNWLKRSEYDPVAESKNYDFATSGAITAWVVGFFYFLLISCCWNSIKVGVAIMEAASDFVS